MSFCFPLVFLLISFTPDFLESTAPHLAEIKRRGIRIVTNGGGINPSACVAMLQSLAKKSGVEFSIAEVTGDDLMAEKEAEEHLNEKMEAVEKDDCS